MVEGARVHKMKHSKLPPAQRELRLLAVQKANTGTGRQWVTDGRYEDLAALTARIKRDFLRAAVRRCIMCFLAALSMALYACLMACCRLSSGSRAASRAMRTVVLTRVFRTLLRTVRFAVCRSDFAVAFR